MHHGAAQAHGKNVGGAAPLHRRQRAGGRAFHFFPDRTVEMHDGPTAAHGVDVAIARAPDILQVHRVLQLPDDPGPPCLIAGDHAPVANDKEVISRFAPDAGVVHPSQVWRNIQPTGAGRLQHGPTLAHGNDVVAIRRKDVGQPVGVALIDGLPGRSAEAHDQPVVTDQDQSAVAIIPQSVQVAPLGDGFGLPLPPDTCQVGAIGPDGHRRLAGQAPHRPQAIQYAAVFAAPGIAVKTENHAEAAHGINVVRGQSPDAVQGLFGAADHGRPGGAVKMDNGAAAAHGIDIVFGKAPNRIEGFADPAVLQGPVLAVKVGHGTVFAHGIDVVEIGAPDAQQIAVGARVTRGPGRAIELVTGPAFPHHHDLIRAFAPHAPQALKILEVPGRPVAVLVSFDDAFFTGDKKVGAGNAPHRAVGVFRGQGLAPGLDLVLDLHRIIATATGHQGHRDAQEHHKQSGPDPKMGPPAKG